MARPPRSVKRYLWTARPESSKLTAHHVGLTKLATARLLQVPGRPHVAAEQPEVGALVANKVLLFRVPDHLAIHANGDVADVAQRVGMNRFVNRAYRLRATLHAVQEVTRMVRAPDELDLEQVFAAVDQVFGLEVDAAAVN